MKKFFAMLLAIMMIFCFAACGDPVESDEPTSPDDAEVTDSYEDLENEESTGITDMDGNEVSQDTIAALTEAYNAIAIPYNEIATAANENGWMADEQTAAEFDALSNTLGFIGAALTEDLSMLDGSDFDALISMLESEVPTALDILSERVSVPYEG